MGEAKYIMSKKKNRKKNKRNNSDKVKQGGGAAPKTVEKAKDRGTEAVGVAEEIVEMADEEVVAVEAVETVKKEETDAAEKDAKIEETQWSVEEIEKETEKAEENERRSEKSKVLEIEVDGEGKRKSKSWIWWIVGAILVLLVAGGVFWGIQLMGNRNNDEQMAEVGGDDGGSDGEKQGEGEEKPAEESEEKPVEEPEETPAEETPAEKPVEQPAEQPNPDPVTPIAPRPDESVDVTGVTPGSKLVALTFDDGPSAATTPRLLDILAANGVKATFFVLGTMAQRSPDILRREVAEGHEVGSHTPYHNQLTNLSFAQVRAEAVEMDRIFTDILGTVPPFTRPPYGSYNATVGQALGQPMILWSVDPRDWADRNAAVVCTRVVNATVDGSIVLVHDIHATTVDAVPCIINELKARGFEFLTVSELAAARGVPLVNGQAYFSF